ncbi:hypothetical protein COC69_20730 [Bacillus cereus]|uniref:Crystaline entomocidal protoxin n=1 Tax=Bacillus cereus TaxID=1396 RepID=A0A9X7CKP5_BACCE|nr:insecticidal delta-endotoxin Cry8Ea1 family protein [Bacillus cereus]PGS77207.1 hypothetical protein COC69_20730 [Bacillus cereus]
MKYKDCIQAKRNYKQTIFAAATTLTLGVSALAGPASAFAAENTKDTQKQSQNVVSKVMSNTGDKAFEILNDGTIKVINEQYFPKGNEEWFKKTLVKMGGQTFLDTMKSLNGNGAMSINNFAKDMVVVSTSLIPYAGAIISPLINLLWPSSVSDSQNQIQLLMKMMDNKISDYDINSLKTDVKAAVEELNKLEVGLQGANGFKAYRTSADYNAGQAEAVNRAFRKIMQNSLKEGLEKSELPIYTMVATAKLIFLSYMVENGGNADFKYDDATLKNAYINSDLAVDINNFEEHIQKISAESVERLNTLNTEVPKAVDQMSALQTKINKLQDAANKGNPEAAAALAGAVELLNKLHTQYDPMIKEQKKLQDYVSSTAKNDAFKVALETAKNTYKKHGGQIKEKDGFHQEGNNWYYTKNGEKQKGWIKDNGKDYYLSKEDGHMKTGWVQFEKDNERDYNPAAVNQDNVTTYYLDTDGHMVTGWKNIGGYYYYFNKPENTGENGHYFKNGEMIKGWIRLSEDGSEKEVADGGYWYYLGRDGSMLKDGTYLTFDRAGTSKQAHFDKYGRYTG